jgi:hypothetical protein
MDQLDEKFAMFLDLVDDRNRNFVLDINDFLMQNNCSCEIKDAKNGYIISYLMKKNKKTLATFVLRKAGARLRILPEYINRYADFLDTLPGNMKKDIQKASVCKRLINPDDCNSRCKMGYDFIMDQEHYKKCRYMAFLLALNSENNPYIKAFLEKELQEQSCA